MERLSEFQQRAVALALLAGVLILVYVVVAVPIREQANAYEESIDELVFRLRRYQSVVAGEKALRARVETIKKQLASDKQFSNRATAALALADLQKFIKAVVVDAGGQLTSTQVVPERNEGEFVRLALNVRMTGDAAVLRDVLHAIEASKPLLFVEDLDIRPVVVRRIRRGGAGSQSSNQLNLNFEVVGYMRANDT